MVDNDDLQRYLAHFRRAGKRPTILFSQPVQEVQVWTPALDMYETAESLVVVFDLAGVDPQTTEVRAEPHLLTVSGVRLERRWSERPGERRSYHALEIPYGRFQRRLHLPPGVDTEAAQAAYHEGLLEITLPKRTPRQVPIRVDEPAPAP